MLGLLRKHGGTIGEWATDKKPKNSKVLQNLKPFQVHMIDAMGVIKMAV